MFARLLTVVVALSISFVAASPSKRAMARFDSNVQIHESCRANKTHQDMLERAFVDVKNLTATAKRYVAANGAEDPVYVRYFGKGDYTAVMGALDTLLSSNMANVTFRCDDPDKNCATQDQWAGHWRGTNATQETVICDLSYTKRSYLKDMCSNNFTIAQSPLNTLWAVDLAHRMWHIPSISDSEIDHIEGGDTFEEVLTLAVNNASYAPYNTHTLQYFMQEVYANEVACPGVGCTGTVPQVQAANTTTASGSGASPSPTSGASALFGAGQTAGLAALGMLTAFSLTL